MPHEHGHVEEPHGHSHSAEPAAGGGLTGYAIVKYGVILLIVVLILWFIANYLLGD